MRRPTTSKERAHTSQTVHAMNGSHRIFSATHPFWEEAIKLRREYHSYAAIVARAHVLGWAEITTQTLRIGLTYAQRSLLLPAQGGDYFRRMYEEVSADFNAFNTLKFFIADVMSELQDIDDELIENDQLTLEQRADLRTRRDELRSLAYTWTKDLVDTQIRIEGVKIEADHTENERQALNIPNYLDTLVTDYKSRINPPNPDELIDAYGAGNIRFPLPALTARTSTASEAEIPVEVLDAESD